MTAASLPFLLASCLAQASPSPTPAALVPDDVRVAAELGRGEAALDAGRAGAALRAAEALLEHPLEPVARRRTLRLAAAAAAMLDDPVRARYYRLAAWADEGVPLDLVRDQAEERYLEVVASAEALLASGQPAARARSVRLLLYDALLALGRWAEAAQAARGLEGGESGELLLAAAERLVEAGSAAAAYDAALAALPPAEEEDEDAAPDRRGFAEARALVLARAATALGEWEAAGREAASLLLADAGERRAAGRALLLTAADGASRQGQLVEVARGAASAGPGPLRAALRLLAAEGSDEACELRQALGAWAGTE